MPISSRMVGYETQSTNENLHSMAGGEEKPVYSGRLKKKAKQKMKLGETPVMGHTVPEPRDV